LWNVARTDLRRAGNQAVRCGPVAIFGQGNALERNMGGHTRSVWNLARIDWQRAGNQAVWVWTAQVPSRNVERFQGGKAHRLLYHSTPGSRVIKKKKCGAVGRGEERHPVAVESCKNRWGEGRESGGKVGVVWTRKDIRSLWKLTRINWGRQAVRFGAVGRV